MKQLAKPLSMEKELKALENRVNVKVTNAVDKLANVRLQQQKILIFFRSLRSKTKNLLE
jgi:hypothetical protein